MQDRDLGTKVGLETSHHLPGQGDFRDQDNGTAVLCQGLGYSLDIDQGFAATGNALQQGGAECAPIQSSADEVNGSLLIDCRRQALGGRDID